MSFLSVLAEVRTIVFGILTFVLEVLPTMGDLFERLGITSWLAKFNAAIEAGGVEADDYIENNVATLDGTIEACDRGIALLTAVRDLAADVKYEGTKVRPAGEADALSAATMAEFTRRLLTLPDYVSAFRSATIAVHPALLVAANADMKKDVSLPPGTTSDMA